MNKPLSARIKGNTYRSSLFFVGFVVIIGINWIFTSFVQNLLIFFYIYIKKYKKYEKKKL